MYPTTLLIPFNGDLGEAYAISPQQISAVSLPKSAFVHIKSPRYRADTLLKYLEKIRIAESADFAFGITAQDISTTKRDADGNIKKPASKYRDWGIMGLAYRPGKTAIVSTYRLKQNHAEFYNRLQKVCIHEFGHNLGLRHCADKNCVMTDAAESVRTIDHCQPALCTECALKIR